MFHLFLAMCYLRLQIAAGVLLEDAFLRHRLLLSLLGYAGLISSDFVCNYDFFSSLCLLIFKNCEKIEIFLI